MSSFWSTDFSSDSTIKDPKRKFRFMVQMTGLNDTSAKTNQVWFAKTCTKPSFQIATAEHKYLNHTFYYPGTVSWQDITLTLVDPQDPDVASSLAEIIDAAKYAVPSTEAGLSTMTKASMASAVGSVVISQLNGVGEPVEEWTLKNAIITEMKFGDLEYGADDLTELSLTLKYDWAELVANEVKSFTSTDTPG